MVHILLCLALGVVLTVHLVHSWSDDFPKRKKTKPFLVPLVALCYLAAAPSVSWLFLVALFAAWLGDMLLMREGNGWFVAGGIAFLVMHVLFIAVYAPFVSFEKAPLGAVGIAAVVYLLLALTVMRTLWKRTPALMRVPMALYLLTNAAMNTMALCILLARPSLGSALAYAGAVLFFASDCMLYLVDFGGKREVLRGYFYVMLTYVPGVFCIAEGIARL